VPASPDRTQLRSEEQQELALTAPFGGIQSELPVSLIEDYGFADCQNLAFRFGTAFNRPTYATLPPLPGLAFGEFVLNFVTFWDSLGLHRQLVFTTNHIYTWDGVGWTVLTPGAGANAVFPLLGPIPFSIAVLNYKLCFANGGPFGTVPVQLFDPQADPLHWFSSGDPGAPLNIAEIGAHLMTSNVNVTGGGLKPQRYQWSGIADPTDWVSFSSGIADEVLDLGPAYGLLKLGQYGFGFHPNGVLQIIATGNGAAPFAFVPLMGADVGPNAIWSLQKLTINGVDLGLFVGPDNVYAFNQTALQAIGNASIGNRRYVGARRRIMADVFASGPLFLTRSYATHSPGGSPYLSYCLLAIKSLADPTQCPLWIYNFDEENWTRWIFNKVPRTLGAFSLVPNTFAPDFGDKLGIGFSDGTVGYVDFGQAGSETSYSITSGKCIYKDRRHKHTTKKFRLCFTDLGSVTWTLTVTNEAGQTQQQTVTLGTGSGDDLSYVFNFSNPSLRLQWTLTAPVGSQFGVVEVAPMVDTGGEQRSGTVDHN
jgi:hypothetical protein